MTSWVVLSVLLLCCNSLGEDLTIQGYPPYFYHFSDTSRESASRKWHYCTLLVTLSSRCLKHQASKDPKTFEKRHFSGIGSYIFGSYCKVEEERNPSSGHEIEVGSQWPVPHVYTLKIGVFNRALGCTHILRAERGKCDYTVILSVIEIFTVPWILKLFKMDSRSFPLVEISQPELLLSFCNNAAIRAFIRADIKHKAISRCSRESRGNNTSFQRFRWEFSCLCVLWWVYSLPSLYEPGDKAPTDPGDSSQCKLGEILDGWT